MVQKKPGPARKTAKKKQASATAAAGAPGAPRRGRPRAFEPDAALAKALATFRDGGFAATSLDDLSAAMGINRPSLYGTFGDKRELFLKAYERYRADMAASFAAVFDPALPLRAMLERLFATALDVYLAGENGPRGCFTVMTATSEAMADPQVRALVQKAIGSTRRTLVKRLEAAVAAGDLPRGADVETLAQVALSTMEALAIRARARLPRAELEAVAKGAVALICGPGTAPEAAGSA